MCTIAHLNIQKFLRVEIIIEIQAVRGFVSSQEIINQTFHKIFLTRLKYPDVLSISR
jgi:hypothetical protein